MWTEGRYRLNIFKKLKSMFYTVSVKLYLEFVVGLGSVISFTLL